MLPNYFEYESSTLNGKLTKLSKPVIIPVLSAKSPPDFIISNNLVLESFYIS